MEICAIESRTLVRAEGVSPTMEGAVVTEPVPLHVVFSFGAGFPEGPVPENYAACAAKRVFIIEVLRPLIVAAMPEDRQVRVKEVTRHFVERLTTHGSCEQEGCRQYHRG